MIRPTARFLSGLPIAVLAVTAAAGVALASSLLVASSAWAASRGIDVELRQSERAGAPVAATVRLYSSSYALVIGIDNYTGGWPRLSNAVKDAELVAAELTERGFEVRLATDLDAAALRSSLRSFFAIKGIDPEARLLLWYAGHGETLDGEGFLVPADAPASSDPLFKVMALHMRDFGGLVRLAASKHVLSVFDSCFSGTIFAARAGSPLAAITRKTTLPVRQFVTSGDAGQLVSDDGSFRTLFLRALRGEAGADFNDDGYLTGDELGLYLSQEVSALTAAAQTPVYGKLQDVRYNQGDFVFALPGGAGKSAVPAGPGAAEIAFWQSVQDSGDPTEFEAYLSRYPNGAFAVLARNRLEKLKASRTTALVSPPKPKLPSPAEPAVGVYPGPGKQLSAEELTALFSGRSHRGTSASGSTWRVEYKADGKMYGKGTGWRDSGNWWLKGNKLCRQWGSMVSRKKECFTVVKDGESYKYFLGKTYRGHFEAI